MGKVVSTRVDEETYRKLEKLAQENNLSIYEILRAVIAKGLQEDEQKIIELAKKLAEEKYKPLKEYMEGLCMLWEVVFKHVKLTHFEKIKYDKWYEKHCKR